MNPLLGPLIERIVVQDVLAGRQPHPDDLKIAAEWNYRFWRKSGNPTEVDVIDHEGPPRRQPRWPTPAWMLDEICWYALGIASAAIAVATILLLWR